MVAQTAASTASSRSVPVWATKAVNTGNAPQASANPAPLWSLPPSSSRLYAGTSAAPTMTSGTIQRVRSSATAIPIAAATVTEPTASATRTLEGISVRNGRPSSSSSAWAPTPIASANATTVHPSVGQSTLAARHPPTTTYDRCQAVYGTCSSVT